MTSSMLILTMLPHIHLHQFDAFTVGDNKTYINTGAMAHTFSKNIINRINKMLDVLDSKDTTIPVGLAFSGIMLNQLAHQDNETYMRLQRFMRKDNVELIAVPYYASSLYLLSSKECAQQLRMQQNYTQKEFSKRARLFLATDDMLNDHIKKGINTLKLKGILMPGKNNGKPTMANLINYTNSSLPVLEQETEHTKDYLEQSPLKVMVLPVDSFTPLLAHELQHNLATQQFVLPSEVFTSNTSRVLPIAKKSVREFGELDLHLAKELAALYGYIESTGDDDLLTQWRLLSHSTVVFGEQEETVPYERYARLMHVYNDIAHKIQAVELARQGISSTEVQLSDSPSTQLKRFFEE